MTGTGRRPAGFTVRPMTGADAAQVLAIYQAGLDGGEASFETQAPAWEAFDATRLPGHRHVAVDDAGGEVLGWAAACAVSDRCVYQGVVEHSVYVAPAARGRGVGAALLRALISSTEAAGIWTIQSGIFPRTPPACACTSGPGSGWSASGSGSAATTAAGAMWSCWNAAAPARAPTDRRLW